MSAAATPADLLALWAPRLRRAREARDRKAPHWEACAKLFHGVYVAARHGEPLPDPEKVVTLPVAGGGDQVQMRVVFRVLEQALALFPDGLGLSAEAQDTSRGLDLSDTHRESLVEAALVQSLRKSGFLGRGREIGERAKMHGLILGLAIIFSHWQRKDRLQVTWEPVYDLSQDGLTLMPVLDDTGAPLMERVETRQPFYESCRDELVSPLEFLCDPDADHLADCRWHAWDRVRPLADLRADGDLGSTLGDHVRGAPFTPKRLFPDDGAPATPDPEYVRHIQVWDRESQTVLHFLEHGGAPPPGVPTVTDGWGLELLAEDGWPVALSDPDATPFSFFAPLPALGRLWPLSAAEQIRVLALEADVARSRGSRAAANLKEILAYTKGTLTDDELAAAYERGDGPVRLGLHNPEDKDLSRLLARLPPPDLDPAHYYRQADRALDDAREVLGASDIPFGGVETATDSDNKMSIGAARSRRRQARWFAFVEAVAYRHLDLLRQFAPDGQSLSVSLPGGEVVVLPYGRAAFQGTFALTASGAGGAANVSPLRLKMVSDLFPALVQVIGPEGSRVLVGELLSWFDIRSKGPLMAAMARFQQGQAAGAPPGIAPGGDGGRLPAPSAPGTATTAQALAGAANVYGK